MSRVGDQASRVTPESATERPGLLMPTRDWPGERSPPSPAAATGGTVPPTTDTLAVLALFEEARLGAELIGRALLDWDKLMLRDLLPNLAADQYWQDVGRAAVRGHGVAQRLLVMREMMFRLQFNEGDYRGETECLRPGLEEERDILLDQVQALDARVEAGVAVEKERVADLAWEAGFEAFRRSAQQRWLHLKFSALQGFRRSPAGGWRSADEVVLPDGGDDGFSAADATDQGGRWGRPPSPPAFFSVFGGSSLVAFDFSFRSIVPRTLFLFCVHALLGL
ncbi:hypothetical protein U1Q18_031221 [Sarracenia purpurea var. burkii]